MTQKKSSNEDEIEVLEVQEPEVEIEGQQEPDVQAPDLKEPPKPDEDVAALKEQLEALQNAQEGYRQREREAQIAAQRAAQDLQTFRHTAEQSQYDSIVTAMGAAEMEVDAAKRDIIVCGSAQDYEGLAHAQERLAAAKTRMITLEQHKDNYERAMHQYAQQAQRPAGDPVLNYIEANPNLTWEEKIWLKEHPEAISNSRKNAELNAAYFEAQDKGIKRGSRDYFHFIEEQLGYREAAKSVEPEQEPDPVIVAAPPSKSSPSGTGTGGKSSRFTMTAEEAEIAKASGISPSEYVVQREKLKDLKKQGHYTAQG